MASKRTRPDKLVRSSSTLDTEYNALRRRMSRLRVQQGHLPVADDMDLEPGDEYYGDLLKFWRKHKIYMGKEMMSSIEDAKAKKKAKQRGRRKSSEFEDLNMNSKTGSLTSPLEELEEENLAEFQLSSDKIISGKTFKKSSSNETKPLHKGIGTAETRKISSSKPSTSSPQSERNGSPKQTQNETKSHGAIKKQLSNGKIPSKAVLERKISDSSKAKK